MNCKETLLSVFTCSSRNLTGLLSRNGGHERIKYDTTTDLSVQLVARLCALMPAYILQNIRTTVSIIKVHHANSERADVSPIETFEGSTIQELYDARVRLYRCRIFWN